MLQKILVPLDGSVSAEIALPFAEEVAAKSNASIALVTATGSGSEDLYPLFRSYLERISEKMRASLASYGTAAAVTDRSVVSGSPADAILRYADEINADLVVMAGRGSTGPGPWMLGSIATRVTIASQIPVLVVKTTAEKTAIEQKKIFKRILVPLDGSAAGEAALPVTQELARIMASELILFHVVQPAATWVGYGMGASYVAIQEPENVKAAALAYLESVRKRVSSKGLSVNTVLEDGAPAERILEYSRNEAVDVIAISTHGRSGVSRWVFGSVTQKVLQFAQPAVLVVHAGKAQPPSI